MEAGSFLYEASQGYMGDVNSVSNMTQLQSHLGRMQESFQMWEHDVFLFSKAGTDSTEKRARRCTWAFSLCWTIQSREAAYAQNFRVVGKGIDYGKTTISNLLA